MGTVGKYCKAYELKQFRQFAHWSEIEENAELESRKVEGKTISSPRELTDDTVLYLQENYVVTDGIFKDKNIIFDQITPEWQEFCHQTLDFQIPDYS